MSESTFDAVVIGSGLGGLTAGALLAKAGRKVCVIERNHSVGGAASVFKKGALTIEPSLHQTADPHDPGEVKHAVLAELGILDEIEWIPVDPFISVKGGPVGETFDLPVGFDAAHHALSRRFPASRHGCARVLGAMEQIVSGVRGLAAAGERRSLIGLLRAGVELRGLVRDWRASAADILDRHLGADEAAKIAIAATVGYYADDPRRLAWPFFAVAQGGFLKSGGRYIKGGSRVLSMKLARVVTKAGGAVLLGREAMGVDIDGSGRPAAVRHVDARTKADEQRVAAAGVFANCAPHALTPMLPPAEAKAMDAAYAGRALSTSLFTAHFGLAVPPARLGLDRYGILFLPDWIASLNQMSEGARLLAADPAERLPWYGIANYGAIDSGLAADGELTLVTAVGLDRLDNWAALPPQEEKDRRERWLDAIQADLDRRYPGFSAAVSERMFLNARSMHNFMNTPGGAVYGFAPLPFERGIWAGFPRSPKTPVPSLYLASAFGEFGGFSGAMRAGALAAEMAIKERAA
ncbi:MAG TPA: NAD(P)/FAD-dependent oxidoreductase [Roseiarcus sp.]|nr:NAD(P)/FAD-dependent oxidoreductase [Roseiarcus sp.]